MNRTFFTHASLALFAFTAALGCTHTTSGGSSGSAAGGGADGASADTRFFLPTGAPDNTSAPTVEVDAAGHTHAVYPAYAIGGAYYAFCGDGCTGPDATQVVRFDTDGTVANAMIALDPAGHPRVLLSSFSKVYYASCDADCGVRESWRFGMILDHGGDREVTGEALALDPSGHPRFLMHTYRAYLGIGQKAPETLWMTCDGADCTAADAWRSSVIAQEIWQGTHLRFDARGRARVATVTSVTANGATTDMAAYVECAADCTNEASWNGIGLGPSYSSETDAVAIKPTVAMALTKAGAPRVAFLGKDDAGKKRILYMGCDADCAGDHWKGMVLSDHEQIDAGLDLALDRNDYPRIVYTLNYNIGLASCDDAHCETGDAKWDLAKVEAGSDMPADQIFPYPNCTVGAWFLHSPSIALTAEGRPRVGYQARDISGGVQTPDPTKPSCVAGTDMTWSRLAMLRTAK